MARGKRFQVAEIGDRAEVQGNYLVRSKTLRVSRAGKPYLSLSLGDKTGTVEARVWDDAERLDSLFDVGSVVAVAGRASVFQGQLQLSVKTIEPLPPEAVAPEDFLPSSRFSLDELLAALRQVAASVENPHIRALLLSFLDDEAFSPRLRVAPAAKAMHHAFLGGLVEHVLSMCQILRRIFPHYQRLYPGLLDRDLLVAGAFLHDIGKVVEIGSDSGFEYTDEGRLVGHIVIGVEMIGRRAAEMDGFPPELLAKLKHLIVAHHGTLEFGSPRPPHTAEALLLHLVDMMDARMNALYGAFVSESGRSWTSYNRMMQCFLLNPLAAAEDAKGEVALPEPDASWMVAVPEASDGGGRKGKKGARADAAEDEPGPENLSLF